MKPRDAGGNKRRLIVNADDYGMDDAVDAAILRLADMGVVTATSAMVLSPNWTEAARKLRDAPLSRGLHVDFTSPFVSAGGGSLGAQMLRAFTRQLDAGTVRAAIERQFTLFESAMGAAPDFVDGHQHVHQFPVIREQLLRALRSRYGMDASRIAVRSCLARHWRGWKAAIVAATGADVFARRAQAAGHGMNSDFAGVYDFRPGTDLAMMWRGWLSNLQGDAPLIMCHVAVASDSAPHHDPIRDARVREYAWLKSADFRNLTDELNFAPAGGFGGLSARASLLR